VRDWPGRARAEQLRQWPTFKDVVEQVSGHPAFEALFLCGSFATGRADDASDIDFIASVADGRFVEAWEQRSELVPPDALFAWDRRADPKRELGAIKYLSREVVKVELSFSTAAGQNLLADPFVVLVGDEKAAERFERRGPIPADELEAYAQRLRREGKVPEVEMRYGDLMRAIRAARS
jgi:predicted nucleotidyltransferase